MRFSLGSALAFLALSLPAFGQAPTTCTSGLCTQQVTCPNGGTTSISGVIYTPNGTDPLPNVLVYIPTAAVDPFTAGVSCPVPGTPPSGSPLVGATTGTDGSFTLTNVPVGANIPLVIQSGRWRRTDQVVPITTACTNTAFSARMPRTKAEGDIPKFAVATGAADQVECVLLKVGIDPSEFTDLGGTGRVNLFAGSGASGSVISQSTTASETTLMSDPAVLNSYDVLMLPCEGGAYPAAKTAAEYTNLVGFANAGGRVYSSHYSYQWMYQNGPFAGVVNWAVNQATLGNSGTGVIDQTFAEGKTLAAWLPLVGATTTPGQITIDTLKHDFNGVIPPTQSWMTLVDPPSNPVMQFVFNAPVGASTNQCGRVLFNEYHVEAPSNGTTPAGTTFPNECNTAVPMTPQEKLLEYSLFELTNDGTAATLTPASADFGSQPINFQTASQTFTWTNNSTFAEGVTLINASGDYVVTGSNCVSVTPGGTCSINVAFNPTTTGTRPGTLSVGSGATTLTSTLTGIGIPDLVVNFTTLNFGNLDVGATATQTLVVTNSASGPVTVPGFVTTGDYSVSTNCPALLAGLASCSVSVTFKPTTTGPRPGTVAVNSSSAAYSGTPSSLTGNGIDFTIVGTPTSGTVVAGLGAALSTLTTPVAGFSSQLSLSCTTNAAASSCTLGSNVFALTAPVTTTVTIGTTSKYTVIGYGGFGGQWMWAVGLGSGLLLWLNRRNGRRLLRGALMLLVLVAASTSLTGCSGHLPAENAAYTAPGTYTYTITATDGFLVHSATYSLTVNAK
ncbi:Abnormal spindle-like microcephaly-assoc'd, ASPM-SPD-2-Hydin [Granulicella rosea]|uniref:Abnormal spindle-like microcephaly-assoc'd, ASPM-SPD-2-Hydin n=1 Tax=Granulicella rosea TaxID=474952 RepID=A0A239CUE9_9BACT|nr:choice-of-anchor D domain-containing protein [Granulicella rosea]SNS23866.1 Abnormal spindle-like microcephaly-assoc'd, ASPM-SPD-2-Hydin [Granulicella rosea]